ncbi:MAG: putative bifunctional diguanylate cyclase/phosphodiesterase [Vulcanimicrobiaceae bacterium]
MDHVITTDHLTDEQVFELTREELDSLPYGVITLDRRGIILRYNYAEAAFARHTPEASIGLNFFTDVAPCTNVHAFKGRFDEFVRSPDSGVEQFDFTFAFRRGSQGISITLLGKAGHDEINLIVRGRDQAAIDIAPVARDATAATGPPRAGAPSAASPASAPGAQELDGTTFWKVGSTDESVWRANIHPDDAASTQYIIATASARRRPYAVEYRTLGPDRELRVIQEFGSLAFGKDSIGCATVDVTEQRRRERELWRLAYYDRLTGLPMRVLVLERIAAAVRESRDSGHIAAVLSLSVTRLDIINQAFGHATGDELLRLVALRLGEYVREGDTVGRLDGATFVVLLTDVDNLASVAASGRAILKAISRPIAVTGRVHHLSASLGISVTPRNGSDSAALLEAAEMAMFESCKEAGRGPVWFSCDLSSEAENNLRTEDELRLGIERNEFVLHYQPIVNIDSGLIVAAEALVRWNHPTRGLVMPNDFIGVAERAGLIVALGDWILRDACRQARTWLDLGRMVRVSVNVSTVQFRQPAFVDFVASVLAETAIPPEMLELELTESILIEGFSDVIEMLTKLKLLGVRLAIDDFGTGYSSLARRQAS